MKPVAKKMKLNPPTQEQVPCFIPKQPPCVPEITPQEPLSTNPTYEEIIFYYGEKQMREELSGPAGRSIIEFVMLYLKLFLKEKKVIGQSITICFIS